MTLTVTIKDNVGILEIEGTDRKVLRSALNEFNHQGVHAVAIRIEEKSINNWMIADFHWLRKRYPLPIVAALVGTIRGKDSLFSLSCDLRIGETNGTLSLPKTRSLTFRKSMKHLLGPHHPAPKEKEVLAIENALTLGLISRIASAEEDSWTLAQEVASTIASRGRLAIRIAKEAVWQGLEMPLEQALRYETDLTLLLQTTNDREEGVRAFIEKRDPKFTGV